MGAVIAGWAVGAVVTGFTIRTPGTGFAVGVEGVVDTGVTCPVVLNVMVSFSVSGAPHSLQ